MSSITEVQHDCFLFMSPETSQGSLVTRNMEHTCSILYVSLGNYVFISDTYIPHSLLPLQIRNRWCQMSTKHFDTGLVPNMADSLLDFGLALSFSIALFFSPCLLTMYYAAASVFCDVPSCFWPSSTTLLKNVEYLHWPSCSNEAFSMCLMSSQCWHSISVSRSQKTLITWISKLPTIYPHALTKCSSELDSMFGQSTANAS